MRQKAMSKGWGHRRGCLGKRICWQRWPGLESRRWNGSDAPFQLTQSALVWGEKGLEDTTGALPSWGA